MRKAIKSKSTIKSSKKVDKKTPTAFKLSAFFAGLAIVLNLVIYFGSILPTYSVINESTDNLKDTLDRSETITNLVSPIIYACLVLAVILLVVGFIKNGRDKPKK